MSNFFYMIKNIPVLLKTYISPQVFRDMYLFFVIKFKRITGLFPVEFHVVEHCNLNCKGCNHFSPLAGEEFLPLENFEKDIKRLSEITKKLYQIKLLGGEPLLHPRLTDFLPVVRKYFPTTPLQITTNGILLTRQPEQFWLDCRKNNTLISISQYPVKLDKKQIKQLSKKYKVRVEYNGTTGENRFCRLPLDIKGSQNIKKSFRKCVISWGCCVTIRDGKLFNCCIAAHIKFFNEHFKQNLAVCEKDYVDIYALNNNARGGGTRNSQRSGRKAIIDFLEKPFPFCRYCRTKDIQFGLRWGISKKEISEWI